MSIDTSHHILEKKTRQNIFRYMIHCENWPDAVRICNHLLDKKDVLQKIQDENLKWWNSQIQFIKETISSIDENGAHVI